MIVMYMVMVCYIIYFVFKHMFLYSVPEASSRCFLSPEPPDCSATHRNRTPFAREQSEQNSFLLCAQSRLYQPEDPILHCTRYYIYQWFF